MPTNFFTRPKIRKAAGDADLREEVRKILALVQ